MSILTRGFISNSILTRGFSKSAIKDFIVAIFIKSRVDILINIASRMGI